MICNNNYKLYLNGQICSMLTPNGQAVGAWQAEQMVPYAYDTTTNMWVGYDNIDSVASKVSSHTFSAIKRILIIVL